MKLDEALQQLDALSAIADRSSTFDGLRAYPTGLTGILAITVAAIQVSVVDRFQDPLTGYLVLWSGVALIALTIVIADMVVRYYRDPTARSRRMTVEVLGRLSPAIVVGAALTIIIYISSPQVAWMLPGLWAILLGLGIYASSSLLPRTLQQVGIWYIGCGLATLMLANGAHQFSPLAMAIPFGGGQCLAAWLIHRVTETEETRDDN